MAFRDDAHLREVQRTPEYRRMVKEYVQNKAPVPLTVFTKAYGEAFFGRSGAMRGVSIKVYSTKTSRDAFIQLMKWTGRAPEEVETWDDWNEFSDS